MTAAQVLVSSHRSWLSGRRSAARGIAIRQEAPSRRACLSASALAAASIAASERRTWLRSVVYQKSGSDARR